MNITEDTRISELIKENKDAIDAIASIAKPLEKLRNPILRKLMASRVTIQEAAKMGGCTIQDFEKVLAPLGFKLLGANSKNKPIEDSIPNWLIKLPKDRIDIFDVRGILSSGKDPLKQIVKRFKEVPIGNALCIINTFVPVPLLRLFEKEGIETFTKPIKANEFHSFFYKVLSSETDIENSKSELKSNVQMLDQESFQQAYNRFSKSNIHEIDVRHLEMPGPMQTILGILPELASNKALYVNHKRIPLYLLEEIAEDNYCVNILNLSETDVKLLIYRSTIS